MLDKKVSASGILEIGKGFPKLISTDLIGSVPLAGAALSEYELHSNNKRVNIEGKVEYWPPPDEETARNNQTYLSGVYVIIVTKIEFVAPSKK